MNVQLRPSPMREAQMKAANVPRIEAIPLEDEAPELQADSQLPLSPSCCSKRKKREKRVKLFQRIVGQITQAAGEQSIAGIECQGTRNINPESSGILKDDQTNEIEVTYQPSSLELLSDLELNYITLTNTRRNSKNNLTKTLSRIQQKLQCLSPHPGLEAIPLIRPAERVTSVKCEDIEELDISESSMTVKEAQPDISKATEHAANLLTYSTGKSTPVVSTMQVVGEAPSARASGIPLGQRFSLTERTNINRANTASKLQNERASVRISTAVVVIGLMQDGDSPALLQIDRDAHPSRTGPSVISSARSNADELASESDIEDRRERRQSSLSDRSNHRSDQLRNKQPILATSLMR